MFIICQQWWAGFGRSEFFQGWTRFCIPLLLTRRRRYRRFVTLAVPSWPWGGSGNFLTSGVQVWGPSSGDLPQALQWFLLLFLSLKIFRCQDHSMGEKMVFLTNGTDTAGYPHAKDWNWNLTLYCIKKLTQNES